MYKAQVLRLMLKDVSSTVKEGKEQARNSYFRIVDSDSEVER